MEVVMTHDWWPMDKAKTIEWCRNTGWVRVYVNGAWHIRQEKIHPGAAEIIGWSMIAKEEEENAGAVP